MPKIISVGTVVPDYEINQNTAKAFAKKIFTDKFRDIERLIKIFDHTLIRQRYFCVPIEWFDKEHTFEEKNSIYIKNAISLSKYAIQKALADTPFALKDIDHFVFVSSTGIATPSIDAHLYNDKDLAFSKNIKRTPIWGLGCAGGAAGLSRAFDFTTADPFAKVLVVALEIGELAFLRKDFSKSNLVATSLFGDGAAAVIVAGDQSAKDLNGFEIISSYSFILKDSLDVMGWEVTNNGFKVIFSKDIPTIINNELKPIVENFLNRNQLTLEELNFFVLHPGGAKVIDAYKEAFYLNDNDVMHAKQILQNYGNMSSPTVLFVLKEVMKIKNLQKGYGLLMALGPGFSAEMLLLKKE